MRAGSAGCPTRTSTGKTTRRMPDASATRPARLGLGAKIFIAATLSVTGVLGVTLGLTSVQAERTADEAIRRGLGGVRRGVQAFLAGRTATFAGMSTVSAEVPQFRERLLKASQRGNVLDQAEEHRRLLGAAWVLITDEHGVLVARTDYPAESDIDLSRGALIANALSGDESSGAWLDERRRKLFMAVAVPLRASPQAAPQGSLVAAYAIDDTLARQIKQATTTDVVFFALDTLNRPYIVGSTLPREAVEPALVADTTTMTALARDTAGTELSAEVEGEHLIGLASPIRSAGGDAFGGFIAFRSHDRELGEFRVLRHTIGFSLALGLLLALASAYVLARQIAGPIRRLALATRRVEDGDYSVENRRQRRRRDRDAVAGVPEPGGGPEGEGETGRVHDGHVGWRTHGGATRYPKGAPVPARRPATGNAVRQPLRGEGSPRHGRYGGGVPGIRPRAAGAGGDQGAPSRNACRGWRGVGALQTGDPPRPQDRPSQRGADVRPGRSERDVLPHDGIRGREVTEGADRDPRPAPRVGHAHDRQATVPGARSGARAGGDPP